MKPLRAVGMGLVGGALALTVALSPARADSGHQSSGTSMHDSTGGPSRSTGRNTSGNQASTHHGVHKARERAGESTWNAAAPSASVTASATSAASATSSKNARSATGRSAARTRTNTTADATTTAATEPATMTKTSAGAKTKRATTVAEMSETKAIAHAAVATASAASVRTAAAVTVADSTTAVTTTPTTAVTTTTTTAVTTTPTTATSTAVKAAPTATAHPTLLNFFGSLMFNVLGVVMQLFAGNPVLPKGSTVTVKVSTLVLPDTGQKVVADWYFPENVDSSTRIIYFQHGFMTVASMYSYTLAALSEATDSIIVAPNLSFNAFDAKAEWIGGVADQKAVADLFVGDRAALTASARAAGFEGTLPTDVVLAGHSLGGALATAAAGYMVDNGAATGLKGVLLMDAVDLDNAIPTALAKLTGAYDVPVYDISSNPYVWNRDGLVGRELAEARPAEFTGVMLEGGRHIDAVQGANSVLEWVEYLLAGTSSAKNIDAVKILAAGWLNDMFAGTTDGSYGSAQQSLEIPTAAGTAIAVVFPFTSTTPVRATPFDGIANVILAAVLGLAVYEPLVGGTQGSAATSSMTPATSRATTLTSSRPT